MGKGDCAGFDRGQGVKRGGQTVIVVTHQLSRGRGCKRDGVGVDQGGEICGVDLFDISEGDDPFFFSF